MPVLVCGVGRIPMGFWIGLVNVPPGRLSRRGISILSPQASHIPAWILGRRNRTKREAAFWATVYLILWGGFIFLVFLTAPDLCTWFMLPFLIFVSLIILFEILGRSKCKA